MNRPSAACNPAPVPQAFRLPDWIAPAVLLIGTTVAGGALGGVSRPLFILGCLFIGWLGWRRGPASHLYMVLLLFAFAPLVRRVVDLSAGYNENGIMLTGPLLAIMVPAVDFFTKWKRGTPFDMRLTPLFMLFGCIIYAEVLTMASGAWNEVIATSIKYFAPLLYAAWLVVYGRSDELLDAAASAFLLILPVTGLYAVYQYVDPPQWDRYWMENASIMSAGQPVPYGVRAFSTMNSPGTYASFVTLGLILVMFLRFRLTTALLMLPAFAGFMLSQYRTGWLAFVAALLFCLLFSKTRWRAGVIIASAVGLGMFALTIPAFYDAIGARLESFSQGSQDGSAQERLDQYVHLWNLPDSGMIGTGFSTIDVGTAGQVAIDGTFIAAWLPMGIPVGIIYIFATILLFAFAVFAPFRQNSRSAIVVGAIGVASLVHVPLANIGPGEIGFMFWSLASLSPAMIGSVKRRGRPEYQAPNDDWRIALPAHFGPGALRRHPLQAPLRPVYGKGTRPG